MFSELVDRCVSIAGRPDQLGNMALIANDVIRQICKKGNWPDDTVEEQIPVPPTGPLIWTPSVGRSRFRREEYIEDATGAEPTAVRPSRRIRDLEFYYYRSGDSFVFHGGRGFIRAYYYAYPPWLQYYPRGRRPSEFDLATQDWTDTTPAALDLVTNWVLERHSSVVEAGVLQRFFAAKQDPRQQLHFSIFTAGLADIQRAEGIEELLGRRRG